MSLRRKNTIVTVLLFFLLLLVPIAAVVQTAWLTQASVAEAERLRRTLNNAGRQIRFDVGFEVASLRTLITPQINDDAAGTTLEQINERFPDLFSLWAEQSRFPDLVSQVAYIETGIEPQVYISDSVNGTFMARTNEPLEWISITGAPIAQIRGTESPVVTVPLAMELRRVSDSTGKSSFEVSDAGLLMLRFDREYLATVVLPELIETYLGTEDYDVWIGVEGESDPLWSLPDRDASTYNPVDQGSADEVIRIDNLGGRVIVPDMNTATLSVEAVRRFQEPVIQHWLGLTGRPPYTDWTIVGPAERAAESEFVVRFRHRSGSIDAAARQSRNRNLAVSYAALLLLAAAVIVMYGLYRRANRQQEREHEFVSTVTHELRTPVSAIHAVADNLSEGIVLDPERVQSYGSALLDESRRLKLMIEQVLLYAGLRGGSRSATSEVVPEELVRTVSERVPELRRDMLTVRIEPNLPTFRGDCVALESILQNLLSNAIKHNGPATAVTLTVRSDHRTRNRGSGGFNLVMEVSDNGRGIPRSELGRVREPFFRGARSQADQVPGSGLGLSLVKRIVDTYGGTLDIQSVQGHGTTVTVRLPFEHGEMHGR